MPVGYDRDGAVASLYRVGGCPTFAYVYPGGTLQSASIGELTAAPAERAASSACWRRPRRRKGLTVSGRGRRAATGWEPAPKQGWVAPHVAAEFPGLGIAWVEVDARPGRSPEPVRAPPPRPLRPLLRRPGDPPARTADPLGLPRLLPPDRPRPRPHPHPGRAARPRPPPRRRLQQPRAARRRADDRHRRDRGRPARLRRRPARGQALHPRLGAGRVAAGPARRDGEGDAGRSPTSAHPIGLLFGADRRGLRGRAATAAGSRSPRSRSRACRRSRSRRRCGWPRRRSDAALTLRLRLRSMP